VPFVWQDNYRSLLPGETREVTATYETKEVGSQAPVVVAEGWNTHRLTVPLKMTRALKQNLNH